MIQRCPYIAYHATTAFIEIYRSSSTFFFTLFRSFVTAVMLLQNKSNEMLVLNY